MKDSAGIEVEWHDKDTFWMPMTTKNDEGQIEKAGAVRV